MQMTIANFLSEAALSDVRDAFAKANFVDGRESAGWAAKDVKRNLQARAGDPALDAARSLIGGQLATNPLFQLAVRPKRISPLLFARYENTMAYGAHVDDAIMGDVRTDVSFTVFLDAPDSYEGGELVMETSAGEQEVKGAAGSLFLYPSTTLHRVEAVRSGVRRVAVGWAQSRIRDAAKRELLFDLDTARRSLHSAGGKTAEFDLVSKSVANLLRMWAE